MKIAILGGSFNPIHNGHIALAKQVVEHLGYNKVLFVPAFCPPHKKLDGGATDKDRLIMVEKAIESFDYFDVETCELEREGTSYTIDTIHFLQNKYKNLTDKIGLIIGDDLIAGFHLWKNVNELIEITDVLLASRLNCDNLHNLECMFTAINNDVLTVSSENIRKLIKKDENWEHFVPKSVQEYIVCNKLYDENN